ncbi:MAG: hypothetical protein ABIB97_01575 [Patescibacteria group bacterium]
MKNRVYIIGIVIVLILGFVNGARYVKKQPIDNSNLPQGKVLAQEIDLSDGRLRDKQRLDDLTLIRYGLTIYYEAEGLYPRNLEELSQYISRIPQDPKEQWINYTYVPIADRSSRYVLSYGLEDGYAGIDFGEHRATQAGMTAGDIIWADSDLDQDGLDDNLETIIFLSDPLNEDSDGDGYTDAHEVYHGYNPLGI